MMPPICIICHKDFRTSDKEGGLVSFVLTKEEKKANKRFEQPGFSGHPDGLHWFCGAHVERAKALAGLTSAEALPVMRKEYVHQQLFIAAETGNTDMLRYCLDYGADVNAHQEDSLKKTPLHLAAKYGHLEAVKLLVERGADTQVRAGTDFTPLHLAVRDGKTAIVAFLLQDEKLTMRLLSDIYTVATMSVTGNPEIIKMVETKIEAFS